MWGEGFLRVLGVLKAGAWVVGVLAMGEMVLGWIGKYALQRLVQKYRQADPQRMDAEKGLLEIRQSAYAVGIVYRFEVAFLWVVGVLCGWIGVGLVFVGSWARGLGCMLLFACTLYLSDLTEVDGGGVWANMDASLGLQRGFLQQWRDRDEKWEKLGKVMLLGGILLIALTRFFQ